MKIEKILKNCGRAYISGATVQIHTDAIHKEPKFVPSFDGEYYSIAHTDKQLRADCPACSKKGTLTGLDGKEYKCPNCGGNWRNRLVVGVVKQWYIKKYRLTSVSVTDSYSTDCVELHFECINDESRFSCDKKITVKGSDIQTMLFVNHYYNDEQELQTHLTDNYAEALEVIKRLNKAEKEKNGDGN